MSSAAVAPPPPPSGGGGSGGGSGSTMNVLSDKVQRALQVRTDTPAMKAALDALAHLPANLSTTTTTNNNNNNNKDEIVLVDSRSVRVAIEQDALQQALLLQGELQKLVDTVVTLRQGVSDMSAIADRLCREIQTDVTVTLAPTPTVLPPLNTTNNNMDEGDGTSGNNGDVATSKNQPPPQLEEAQLARTLYDAFCARDQAEQRFKVVQEFLDKFDLSEEDSRLLDHYNFEDVVDSSVSECPIHGMAFLKALERVVKIRAALSDSFGGSTGSTGMSSSFASGDSTSSSSGDGGLGASSALRMMESLAHKQEQAYERLYHWLQSYLQLSGSSHHHQSQQQQDDAEDRLDEIVSHPFCQLALQTLQHVPPFYNHTLELIATARRSQATKQFLLALTSGYAGMPPLEMKAHDSVAYVGDMLAFCFRAFSVEADFAKTMQSLQLPPHHGLDDNENDDENANNTKDQQGMNTSEHEDFELTLSHGNMATASISSLETLALTMSGVARPLKSRILQVIASLARSVQQEDGDGADGADDDLESHDSMMDDLEEGNRARQKVTQLYQICGLLLFYSNAMDTVQNKLLVTGDAGRNSSQRSLGGARPEDAPVTSERSPLMTAVLECLSEATSAYEATFRVYAAMLEQLTLASGDSEAALAHQLVVAIAESRVQSPGFSKDVPCPKEFQTTLSLEWALEVILEASLNSCKTLDDAHLLQKAILISKTTGELSDAAQDLIQRIHDKESELINDLVTREATNVMELCGLASTATAWKNFQQASADGGALHETLAAYPGLSPYEVQEAVKEFYSSLYSPPLPSLETVIKDPVVRKAARRQVAQRVCMFYAELYEAIMAAHAGESGGYEDISFLGHTPEQVTTLFSA